MPGPELRDDQGQTAPRRESLRKMVVMEVKRIKSVFQPRFRVAMENAMI